MGCGKSTVGALVAKSLDFDYIDTDQLIEKREKRKVSEIFEQEGEAYFRNLESNLLDELCHYQNVVVSTGGGFPVTEKNIKKINKYGVSFYLSLNIDKLISRINNDKTRPLALKSKSQLSLLLNQRKLFYLQADYKILADRPLDLIVKRIVFLYGKKQEM
jgi:shikimate kinase